MTITEAAEAAFWKAARHRYVPVRKPLPFRSIAMALDPSMPILVVDDYQTMIRIIRNLLKQLGFENVDDASDGSVAIEKMRDK